MTTIIPEDAVPARQTAGGQFEITQRRSPAGLAWVLAGFLMLPGLPGAAAAETKVASENGTIQITAILPGHTTEEKEPPLIFSTRLQGRLEAGPHAVRQTWQLDLHRIQGALKQAVFGLQGQGTVTEVSGEGLLDWGMRWTPRGERLLVVHFEEGFQKHTNLQLVARAEFGWTNLPVTVEPLTLQAHETTLFGGQWELRADETLSVILAEKEGLISLGDGGEMQTAAPAPGRRDGVWQFQLTGQPYRLALSLDIADPELRKVRFRDFDLRGRVQGDRATFVLQGEVQVNDPRGGAMPLLSGDAALTDFTPQEGMTLHLREGVYVMRFASAGAYPVRMEFDARILETQGWKRLSVGLPSAALRPVRLEGLPADVEMEFPAGARPRREGEAHMGFLPAAGLMEIRWQQARESEDGKLFFAVNAASQVAVSPGLARQTARFQYRVMQGEIQDLVLNLEGEGEITRVQGAGILTWRVQPAEGDMPRRLWVRLNEPLKSAYSLVVGSQTSLGAFPLNFEPMRIVPQGAIRFGGHTRVVNEGAVRLEVVASTGLAQISPQQFPDVQEWDRLVSGDEAQMFAFRFSGEEFGMEIRADNILPEIAVSQLLLYHLAETETSVEGELELDIREAPLREFELIVPGGYSVASLRAPSLSDYQMSRGGDDGPDRLRIQFGQPMSGRQVISLRLTRSHSAPGTNWTLVPLEAVGVKSVRGFVGMSADPGLRLQESQMEGLTEIATAFFPKRVPTMQLSYRLREPGWNVALQVERLAQSLQVDSFHLFSVGEGMIYGSSLMNYLVSGAPVSVFQVQAPSNFTNVEFVGRDVRHWREVAGGYEVHLHTPVSGAYSLLATYDFQFNPRGEQLTFAGMIPLGVQAEQGHVLLVSAYQFQPEIVSTSGGLISLEAAEIPVEYRLLYDAPVLAAYQFTARPFELQVRLTSLEQGETVNQVVDRATFHTHISGEGQVLTDATYLVKSKGFSHLRLTVPAGVTLWSVRVDDEKVVPVVDGEATLIPLPQDAAPDRAMAVALKLAIKSDDPGRIQVPLPQVAAPILLAGWTMEPDPGYRLSFRSGDLRPVGAVTDVSGFAWLQRLWSDGAERDRLALFWGSVFLALVGAMVARWGTRPGMRRWSLENSLCLVVAVGAWILAVAGLVQLLGYAADHPLQPEQGLNFSMPVQVSHQALQVEVVNRQVDGFSWAWLNGWPIALGVLAWFWGWFADWRGLARQGMVAAGWTLVFWGCLRMPNSVPAFLVLILVFAFFHLLWPMLQRQRSLPPRERAADASAQQDKPATGNATAAWLLFLTLAWGGAGSGLATAAQPATANPHGSPDSILHSVEQTGRVEGRRVLLSAELNWHADEGAVLDFLRDPAILTSVEHVPGAVRLVQENEGGKAVHRLIARQVGPHRILVQYELPVNSKDGATGFDLPTRHGLINRLDLTLDRTNVVLTAPQAVSVVEKDQSPLRYALVLAPHDGIRVDWKPRTRDVSLEQTIFYAELAHLFIPSSSVVEGVHAVTVRPAQGLVRELAFRTPPGSTVTDVQAEGVASWTFDPDRGELRVQMDPPESGSFAVRIYSQSAAEPMPYEETLSLVSVAEAAGQVNLVGVATGSEVQLERAEANGLTPINLEDFPVALVQDRAGDIAGLTLRRAFRTGGASGALTLAVSAVQPDIRMVSRQTLSMGEDRTLLAAEVETTITRAGIFKVSFVLPAEFDVESITGEVLSHWTEWRADDARGVTLHMKGKTEGTHRFHVSLTGQGVPAGSGWEVPRLIFREAEKQTGDLMVVPEQGMRLSVAGREGVTQLDPQQAGVQRKGVLAFRLLHAEWQLQLDVEKVDPWVQVASLQDVTVREGQLKVATRLDYEIENAGLKSLWVALPEAADGVRFSGDQVADAVRTDTVQGGRRLWEVKLDRRVLGQYRLLVHYQVTTNAALVTSVEARQVNLHRGYLTLRAGGRLQVSIPSLPSPLQRVDWRSLPASLRGGDSLPEGQHTFRAIESEYVLALQVVRHDAARLLPARVEKTELTTMVSASGEMLTQVRLTLQPGDKNVLRLQLPPAAQFWFAFVDGAGVWPWKEGEQILIPLQQHFQPDASAVVEFLYALPPGTLGRRYADFELVGPELDLPLEQISWNVYLPPNRRLADWEGELQLQETSSGEGSLPVNLQSYLQQESGQQAEQTREAEAMLQLGNEYLSKGEQERARKAYQSAWNLSKHDEAFNEDARVQLQNLKMQQALVGLNYRRNAAFQDAAGQQSGAASTNAALSILQASQAPQFTEQQVQRALQANSAEDNSALMKLAEHLVEQQDAAQAAPEAIRTTLPRQGHQLLFARSLLVDTFTPLRLHLETEPAQTLSGGGRALALLGCLLGLSVFLFLGRKDAASA